MKNIKIGLEFSLDGKSAEVYKITKVLEDNRFLAIYIGNYAEKDVTTYNGFVKHSDFRLDNALFEINESGEITMIQQATGMLHFQEAPDVYKQIIDKL